MKSNRLINKQLQMLEKTNQTLEDYFNLIHQDENALFCETVINNHCIKTTYGECKLYSKKMANYFEQNLKNVAKHSFIGVMIENRLEFITSMFGLLMAGYKPMLLNLKLNQSLNEEIIKTLDIKYVVCDKDYSINVNKIYVDKIIYDELEVNNKAYEWEDEIAISTSATSLNIKICVYDGKSICEQIKNMKGIYKQNSIIADVKNKQLKHLAFLPFYHIFGLMAMYFWFTLVRSSFLFVRDGTSENLIKSIREYNVTHIFAVPLLWNAITKNVIREVDSKDVKLRNKFYDGIKLSNKLQSIFPKLGNKFAKRLFKDVRVKLFGDSPTFLVTGGSDIPEETIKIINGLGYQLFNGYGMSEIGITSVELSKKAKHRNLASIGMPFDKAEYKISDDGNLLVKSKGLCKYIITKNEKTEIDKDKYFDTGDFAKNIKGRYYILGRKDDIVLTDNGEKINPNLIEKQLKIPYVDKFSVLGIEINNNEYLCLLLEINKNIDQMTILKLTNNIAENLRYLEEYNFKIDKIYYTYDSITSPGMIKVSRKALRRWIEDKTVRIYDFSNLKTFQNHKLSEQETSIGERVKNIFKEILDIDLSLINYDSHFTFDLGGTSLDYLSLISRLSEEFEISFDDCDNYNTVIEFTEYIIRKKN